MSTSAGGASGVIKNGQHDCIYCLRDPVMLIVCQHVVDMQDTKVVPDVAPSGIRSLRCEACDTALREHPTIVPIGPPWDYFQLVCLDCHDSLFDWFERAGKIVLPEPEPD
jgi:hypothetical protein